MKWTRVLVVLLGIAVALGTVVVLGYGQLAGAAGQPDGAPEQRTSASQGQDAGAELEANLTRTNEGGAVTFEVTPLNLGNSSDTLDFRVAMDTHSVELGFDLAAQAVLRTDTGAEIAPSAYQGGSGHHVDGRLSFPAAKTAGARTLTLLIRDVAGVAERVFVWQLQ
jgi:hypothetical protein